VRWLFAACRNSRGRGNAARGRARRTKQQGSVETWKAARDTLKIFGPASWHDLENQIPLPLGGGRRLYGKTQIVETYKAERTGMIVERRQTLAERLAGCLSSERASLSESSIQWGNACMKIPECWTICRIAAVCSRCGTQVGFSMKPY
jgi:hypothetical protein